ncbi:hypothetical protein [Thermoflexus sp.]|uniref:hypothetical protein n=1 Tax=Thermoflexus sp. TaxID=1969742 RepID=UPI002ADDABC4|nr:hypothetical protein [Thermoflexus sp.]
MASFITDAIVSVLARFLSSAIYIFLVTPLSFMVGVLLVIVNIARHMTPSGGIPYVLIGTGDRMVFLLTERDGGAAVVIPHQLVVYLLAGHAILYFLFHAVAHRHAGIYESIELVKTSSVGFLISLVYTGWFLVILNLMVAVLNSAIVPFMNIIRGFLFTGEGIPTYITVGALLVSSHIAISLTTPIPPDLVIGFGMAVLAYLLCILMVLALYLIAAAGFIFAPIGLIQYWLRTTLQSVGGMLQDWGDVRAPGIVRLSLVSVLAGGLGVAVSREFFRIVVQNIYSFARAVSGGNYGFATEAMRMVADTLYADPVTRSTMGLEGVSACSLPAGCSAALLVAVGMGAIGIVITITLVFVFRGIVGVLSASVPRAVEQGRQRAIGIKERIMAMVSYQWELVRNRSRFLRQSVPASVREMVRRTGIGKL